MASNGDEEKYAMPPDDDLRNFVRVAQRAIENKQDAMKYIDMLLDTGMIYHFDDDPAEGLMHGGKGWSAKILPDITDLMGQRHKEMWNHIEPHDYLDLHPEMVDMMFERNEEGEVSPEDRQDLGLFTMGSDAFEQAWGIAKDVYYGDKDMRGIKTQREGSTLGMPSLHSNIPQESGFSRPHMSDQWFGTNLSNIGQSIDWNQIPEDEMDDYAIDQLSEIETHEGTHVAQYPMLQQAAREEQQRRIEDAKARGVKVIGDDKRRSLMDVLSRREVKRPKDFAVSDEQMSEWDETGAFAAQLGTANRNWNGLPASMQNIKGITPDMSDRDIRERIFERFYPRIVEDRKRRTNA